MGTGNLLYHKMDETDSILIHLFTQQDSFWRSVEIKHMTSKDYMNKYADGEWRIWRQGERDVAVTYHLECAPSNNKPWIGTVIVNDKYRRLGYGIKVVEQLKQELGEKGHKAMFAGVPVEANAWIQFLSDCYFEQFKIEKDEQNKMVLIMVSPLQ